MFLHVHKVNLLIVLLSIAIFLTLSVSIGMAQKQALGEFKIEGEHIESLVLRHLDDRHTENFEPPFEARKIPVGKYRLQNIRLEGGYYCGTKNDITVSVEKDETSVFKIGAPLRNIIEVKRQGRVLEIRYKLLGMAGEDYSVPARDNPPGFTVFKGDKEIASGKFEYG